MSAFVVGAVLVVDNNVADPIERCSETRGPQKQHRLHRVDLPNMLPWSLLVLCLTPADTSQWFVFQSDWCT